MRTEYKYQVGEVVNETLKIVSQTRYGKQNRKAYEVQSLVYPDAPTYVVLENNIVSGVKCAYKRGLRIYEGNSLYSKKEFREYLVDKEQAKTIAPYSRKRIKLKCPKCGKEQVNTPNHLLIQGLSCVNCRNYSKDYKYSKGDIVNDSLLIVEQTPSKNGSGRCYEVQSIAFPDAPTYKVKEHDLVKGHKDGYERGLRIYEGNSLYSVEWVRPYLVDKEQAKTIAKYSGKKITLKCPECERQKEMRPATLLDRGFSCSTCSSSISYPELLFKSYLEFKGIKFEYQKRFEGLPNRFFDFVTVIDGNIYAWETHGMQHYEDNKIWKHEDILKSDRIKEDFCKSNNINYMVIDCRKSEFTFIIENINKIDILPKVDKKEEKEIIKIMEINKRHPIKDMVQLYKKGKNTVYIAKIYGLSDGTVGSLLRRNGIEVTKRKKVKCLTTGVVFTSLTNACLEYGISTGNLSMAIQEKYSRTTAGKHPETGEPLRWEYVD